MVAIGVEGPEDGDDEMSDEQEDFGHSMTINNELRLCGMTGDDEDDVVGDAEELFGHRVVVVHAFNFLFSYLCCSFFLFFLNWSLNSKFLKLPCALVPRHDTIPMDCPALLHGTALSEHLSVMPGRGSKHGGTTWHGTIGSPCLIMSCRIVLVSCSASAVRLENYTHNPC